MELVSRTEIRIRFSEMDPVGIVWHGNYVKYFEDGREAFGREFDLNYVDFYKSDLIAPLVKMDYNFKKDLKYGEKAIVETRYCDTEAAKIQFEYKIFRHSNHELVTTGSTTQVFLNSKGQLLLAIPPMFKQWKEKWGLS